MIVAFVDVIQAVVQYCAWARVPNDVRVVTLSLDGAASQAFNAAVANAARYIPHLHSCKVLLALAVVH